MNNLTQLKEEIMPMLQLNIPNIISNDLALCSGAICGLSSVFLNKKILDKILTCFDLSVKYFFKILIFVMPIFIIGNALKLQHAGMLFVIYKNYLPVLVVFVFSAYGIVFLQYLALAKMQISKFVFYFKNIIPAAIVGFGAMSSAAALPLSIRAANNNLNNAKNAAIIVPSTVNIHLVGDCFFIPMLAITIMQSFGLEWPSMLQYVTFAIHFVITKFAVAAVPAGGILVMLPILQNYLNFNPEMLGFITALYVLFDPIITTCNIVGNGALAIFFDKINSTKN
jgi:Na+/H+-dicarboxylate symporter